MTERPSTDKQRGSLKMAVARAIDALGGNKIVAGFTRVNDTMLSLYRADHEAVRHAGLDVAFDIDMAHALAGREPPICATYVALLGFDLARRDAAATSAALDLADCTRLDRESFELRMALLESIQDGMTPAEKKRLLSELADMKAAIAAVEAKIEAA